MNNYDICVTQIKASFKTEFCYLKNFKNYNLKFNLHYNFCV